MTGSAADASAAAPYPPGHGPAHEAAEGPADPQRPLLIVTVVVAVLATVAVIALITMSVLNLRQRSITADRNDRDLALIEGYRQMGAQVAEDYLDFSYLTMDQDVQAIADNVSGIAKDRFAESSDQWTELVNLMETVSEGEVLYSAVQDFDDEQAMVLVLGRAMVSNKEEPVPHEGYFTLRMLVERDGEGFTVTNMDYANR